MVWLAWNRFSSFQHTRKEETTTSSSKKIQQYTEPSDKTRTFFSHLCEFSLLRHRAFALFCAAYLLLMVNSSAFWYHLQSRAVYKGKATEFTEMWVVWKQPYLGLYVREYKTVWRFGHKNCLSLIYYYSSLEIKKESNHNHK